MGGVDSPMGVAEHFAPDHDEIGAAFGDDEVGLFGGGDLSDGSRRERGVLFDGFGEMDLVAGAGGDGGIHDGAAGAAIEEIEAEWHEVLGEADRVLNGPAAFDPVGGGDAYEEGLFFGPDGADGGDELAVESGPVFVGAAVGVSAGVTEGAEELVEEVAVGAVEFDAVEIGAVSAVGGSDPVTDHLVDPIEGEGFGGGGAFAEGDGGGGDAGEGPIGEIASDGGPGAVGASFAAAVGELDAAVGAGAADGGGDGGESGDVVIGPDAEVFGGDDTIRADGGGFGDDEGGAAVCAGGEVGDVPIAGDTVSVFAAVGAHGGEGDAVSESEATEGEGIEEMGHGVWNQYESEVVVLGGSGG